MRLSLVGSKSDSGLRTMYCCKCNPDLIKKQLPCSLSDAGTLYSCHCPYVARLRWFSDSYTRRELGGRLYSFDRTFGHNHQSAFKPKNRRKVGHFLP